MGEDKLDPFFLKVASPIVVNYITYIFNLSVLNGTVPKIWIVAYVTPLHKGGGTDNLNNYRPISKLSCLSKVLEFLVKKQFKSLISTHCILSMHQSGFRERHSMITAATFALNDIITALDRKKHCAALFIDLSKAFDAVDHVLLLKILRSLRFDDLAFKWFQSYLSDRQQCVGIGDSKSEFVQLAKGVPQDSILGPLLFSLYINDITSVVTGVMFIYMQMTPFCTALQMMHTLP